MGSTTATKHLRRRTLALRRAQRLLANDLKPVPKRPLVPVREPLLVITQIQRSGGTLLSQLFDGHPQIHPHPHELYVGRPRKWNWPDLDPSRLSARHAFRALYERTTDRFILDGYAKRSRGGAGSTGAERHPFRFSRSYQRRIFARCWQAWAPTSQRDILDAYWTSYFNAWLDYDPDAVDARFVSGFVPRLNMIPDSTERFFRDYPDGRMITVVREPCGWYASASRHDDKYADVATAVDLWAASAARSLELAKERPDQVRLLLFEDLVLRTEEVFRDLAGWLGLDWDDRLLEPTFNGHPMAADSSFRVDGYGVTSGSASRSSVLPDETRAAVEARAGDLYERVRSFLQA